MKTIHIILALLAATLLGVPASQPFLFPLVFLVLLAFKLSASRLDALGNLPETRLDISWTAVLAPLWIPLALDIVMQFLINLVAGTLLPVVVQIIQQLAVSKGPLT